MSAPQKNPRSSADDAHRDDTVLDWARSTGEADRLVADLEALVRRRRRSRVGLAAGVAVVLLSAAVWQPWRGILPRVDSVPEASLIVSRPAIRTLKDGSMVELRGEARIEVTFTGPLRRVVLHSGEAHFQVAKDPARPFVVVAGATEVRAVGTAFAVDFAAGAVEVVVTEGRVRIGSPAPGAATATLDAGNRAVVSDGTAPIVASLSPPQMQARLAWRVPRLEFSATPLASVLAMMNEHATRLRGPTLVLAEPALGELRVSGVLRADDPESLLRLLEGEFGLVSERTGGAIRLRRR